ncbi:MAG TPA: hypothetical protein VFH76_02040, partial [Kribbella sp.]|nr:hypothetical protein [Kribbella sp.]
RWWNNESLVQAAFGHRIDDLYTLALASQFLQRDGLGYAVEAHRRRWPRSVGTLPWQFNEPYPNAWCTAAVTHAGEPKPAYFAVAAAYRPVIVGATCSRQSWAGHPEVVVSLWFVADNPVEPATLTAGLFSLSGEELAGISFKDVTRAQDVGELRAPTPPGAFILQVRLAAGDVRAERRYLLTGAEDLSELLDGRAEIDVEWSDDQLVVRHVAGPAAPLVRVRDGRPWSDDAGGWLRVSDSGFVLLPGERRVLDVRWEGAGGDRLIAVDGLGLHPTERLIRCNRL